jgi:uncharacterized protein
MLGSVSGQSKRRRQVHVAQRLNEFVVVFVSIVVQSMPFVLVGVFASALVQQRLSDAVVARWLPRRPVLAVLLGSVFGFIAPVCDCGVIPLARRLTAKGVPLYAAIALILAAPVVNPVVLLATLIAFQGSWLIACLRLGMTLSVAMTTALLSHRLLPATRAGVLRSPSLSDFAESEPARPGRAGRLVELVSNATAEYFDVIFFIILGALFTAATQAFVPRGDLTNLGSSRLGSLVALMPLGTILSICSEADAFVARAFATNFSLGAVLAFMTIGQLVDLRNGLLLLRTLGPRLVLLIVVVAYPLIFLEGAMINQLVGRV